MRTPAKEEEFEHIEINGKPALFSNNRIAYSTVPKGFYPYELRGSDDAPGEPTSLERRVGVNFAGTVITADNLKFPKSKNYITIKDELIFFEESMSLHEFADRHSLRLPEDNRKFILRPTSEGKEMFYSQGEELDKTLGCVGHLRIDFGRNGTEFWHTWNEHNENLLNTEEFKVVFDEILSELRKQGPLKSRASMAYFCIDQGAGPLDGNDCPQYGFTT